MAIISILILFSQNIKLFIIMFMMNVLRQGQETIIDPLFTLANAPITLTVDFILHAIIVSIEIGTLIKLIKIYKTISMYHKKSDLD